jgi:hypothetical protein
MKKGIALTSLALLLTTTVAGCSCGKNGEYHVSHIEYVEDGETKETDCTNIEDLPVTVGLFCQDYNLVVLSDDASFIVDGNTITFPESNGVTYFKVKKHKVLISDTKDGEYTETDIIYKRQEFKKELSNNIYLVYSK